VSDVVFLYVTHPDAKQALSLGRMLVADGLAACANVLPGMLSVYRWEDRIEDAEEAVMIVKTRTDLAAAAQAAIVAVHPFACPCVVIIPIAGGHPAYLDWLMKSSRSG
jgi:periplasmic divalent cation tolerance protein